MHHAKKTASKTSLTTMAADAVSIRVRVGDRDHAVLCSSGMLVDELRYVLGSAFEVDAAHIAGLVSDAGVCSPLSLVARAPQAFASNTYTLLVKPEAFTEQQPSEQPPQPTPLATIAGAANLNAVDVDDAMAILREQSDASGRLDKAAFVVGLEAALGDNQTPRSRAALAALFDVVRSRTAIHAATRVPPDCVRARA